MSTKLRFLVASILTGMLLLSSFAVPTKAQNLVQARKLIPIVMSNLYNNIPLKRPSWWSGKCDTNGYQNGHTFNGNFYPGTGVPAFEIGTVTYRGLYPCGPQPLDGGKDAEVIFYTGADGEFEWECTELAKWYLLQAYGAPDNNVASGGQVVDTYQNDLLQEIKNVAGSGNAPQVGDIIGNSTHVAIVKAVDSSVPTTGYGNIIVMDENGIQVSQGGVGTQKWKDTNWSINNGVTGWLHPRTLVTDVNANPTPYENILYAVTTASTGGVGDVWAVGHTQLQSGLHQLLAEHWNGISWTANSPPPQNVGSFDNQFFGVAALSQNSVWAVGDYLDSNNVPNTLLEHYNGSKWEKPISTGLGQILAITKVSSSEAWAVGTDGSGHPLMEHLVHGKWTSISDSTTFAVLNGVSAVSGSVMAVGETNSKAIAYLWNGTSWTQTNPAPPSPSSVENRLFAVYALNATHIYAVGDTSGNGTTLNGYVTMWNGSSWSTPVYGPSNSSFAGAYALSSSNIWIVGSVGTSTLVEQYNGTSWSQVTSNSVGTVSNLYGVTINPKNGNVWTVGNGTVSGWAQTLTEFFN